MNTLGTHWYVHRHGALHVCNPKGSQRHTAPCHHTALLINCTTYLRKMVKNKSLLFSRLHTAAVLAALPPAGSCPPDAGLLGSPVPGVVGISSPRPDRRALAGVLLGALPPTLALLLPGRLRCVSVSHALPLPALPPDPGVAAAAHPSTPGLLAEPAPAGVQSGPAVCPCCCCGQGVEADTTPAALPGTAVAAAPAARAFASMLTSAGLNCCRYGLHTMACCSSTGMQDRSLLQH